MQLLAARFVGERVQDQRSPFAIIDGSTKEVDEAAAEKRTITQPKNVIEEAVLENATGFQSTIRVIPADY